MKNFLKGAGQLLLIWLAIIALVVSTAAILAATDPLKDIPYVSTRGAV
ncbi:hypothetical protein ACFSHT_22230 [Paraburkholderia silviterrae]|nr:hypothetical protein [Paraburkholderia silviterrae]